MSKLQKKLIVGAIIIILLGISGYMMQYAKKHYRQELLNNTVVQRMIPTYRSLRKLPDILFMPWAVFQKSELPKYEITITPQNINKLNEALPDRPFNTVLLDDAKVWVPAYFRTDGYEGNVDIRYRGNLPSHWNAYQKSYIIEFPKDHLFEGKERISLIIPSDRSYIDTSLNNYRAEKLGLISFDESLVRVEINGADNGILIAFEAWSQPWIEKMPISALSEIYGLDEYVDGMTYQDRWKSWNAEEPIDFDPLKALEEIVDHASDEDFKRLIPLIIDIEDYYGWDVMRILAAGYHDDYDTSFGANNLVLIFDRAEGRFKPVPYNVTIHTPSIREGYGITGSAGAPPRLMQRILSIPEFRARRDELFYDYVKNEKEDDLRFVAEWKAKYNREFLLDNAKNDNHFMYLVKIKETTQSIVEHFDDPFDMIGITYDPLVEVKDELDLPASFEYLQAAGVSPETASLQHPSLYFNGNEITVPAGIHTFTKTIIIPAGTKLGIAPGATLLMDDGVSFISYSPVTAEGTVARPITIRPLNQNKSWGVFAVINTQDSTSSFDHVKLINGSEDKINGITISGMLALHNARSTITNVSINEAKGDDGINVKGAYTELTETVFQSNFSDGVDLDYIHPDSLISHNTFIDSGGDAIDLSWDNIVIDHNVIKTCGDKGISVGEKSDVQITENEISNCPIGVAIKDSSRALIYNNNLSDNATAFSLYEKKLFFGGGHATATANNLIGNGNVSYLDNLSTLSLENNSVVPK